ncbi:MAG: sulfatase-like hydrolase/transferase, partial [Planctomycetes bacterium]|nr:sulfatase-like hydrolase/transferase [Planctomycetota bacterium]
MASDNHTLATQHRPPEMFGSLLGCHLLSLPWLLWMVLLASLVVFRGVFTADLAAAIDVKDVPLFKFFVDYYGTIYWGTVALGGLHVALGLLVYRDRLAVDPLRRTSVTWAALKLSIGSALILLLGAIGCRYRSGDTSADLDLQGTNLLDWALVLLVPLATHWVLVLISHADADDYDDAAVVAPAPSRIAPAGVVSRLGLIYLLGCAAVLAFAVQEHYRFWDENLNGNYHYQQFFASEAEIDQAKLVFVSTSLLFASLAALAGCAGWLILRLVSRSGESTAADPGRAAMRRQALVLASLWAVALMVPWQIKLRGEIIAEEGWIMPAVTLLFTVAALTPMLLACRLMMQRDFDWCRVRKQGAPNDSTGNVTAHGSSGFYPSPGDFALWTTLLFPIYPLLRPLRALPMGVFWLAITVLTVAVVAPLTWLANHASEMFTFDDWRGMLKEAQFPFFQVLCSLLTAWLFYCVIHLIARCGKNAAVRRFSGSGVRGAARFGRIVPAAVVSLASLAVALSATWPFWGWQNVSPNVFARAIEFNDRHAFELNFLHWVFDADRDGYAAVLHGADADDFDSQIQAGGIGPPRTVAVPIDEFEIVDANKAAGAPNVVIFYLEGVVPRSISAYGERHLPNGLVATPHIDSVAADGTLFRQARCYYPSTWDAWFAVTSGRILYVKEMSESEGQFNDRYSRYNNLYKVLNLCGISRWCHGDVSPYYSLFVPPEMRGEGKPTDWKPETDDYKTALTKQQREAGYWRGDNRNQRMLEFIDDLKPGEKFFICEHMSDTHFPWERTDLSRAQELGFPQGLRLYEADAELPAIGRDDQESTYARYFQTITRMDGQIGQILDKLKERRLYDNTMIVIVSDHGCQWLEHRHMYYVEHLYEQSIRVPLIIKAPGLPGGTENNAPVLQIDVLPTLMELAGARLANPRGDYPLAGRSLVPLMRGDRSAELLASYRQRDVPLKTHYDTIGLLSQSRYKLIFER